VRYFTQEIVLFRENLLKQMQRRLALPLETSTDTSLPDITEQLADTVLQQAHLCPLPLQAR
jgi:DNA polymerase epsilon subunit 2